MIPAAFEYTKASSVDEAVKALDKYGEDAKLLAGGHSLIPLMRLRLAQPKALVDINGVESLGRLATEANKLRIGACVRHAAFYECVAEGPLAALLSTVVQHIAHHPIRITFATCSRARSAAGPAMNSRSLSAVSITVRSIAPATSERGGGRLASIQTRSPVHCGKTPA